VPDATSARETEPLIVVSTDSHVSPNVAEYRPYCEARFLPKFDEYVAVIEDHLLVALGEQSAAPTERTRRYIEASEACFDPGSDLDARLQHMDEDGVAAEIVFHGGFNRQPIPFFSRMLGHTFNQDLPAGREAQELRGAGIRMYNRWLADWTAKAPGRLIGVAHLPLWDLESAITEVEWAADHGIRAVNFPSPRPGLPGYNMPAWDSLWAACVEQGISLHTHGGGGDFLPPVEGPGKLGISLGEMFYFTRRGMSQMIFGGAFERYPDLKLFLTEQNGCWMVDTLQTLDSAYLAKGQERESPYLLDWLPRLPSEYFRSNVFVGASFMSRAEATMAVEADLWRNMLWGRDYPHPEGTWPFTRASLRKTFAGLPPEPVVGMLGENAVAVLGLDRGELRRVAARIGPTLAQVDEPLEHRPVGSDLSMGFREVGSFA
jgi:predicted TIM-barrel fold metal-dependent hydrolase